MKHFLKTLSLIMLLMPPALYGQYEIIWADEFDGTSLDLEKWTFDIGAGGWGNAEPQYYTSNSTNVDVDTGYLRITALNESYSGADYTSARIKTQSLFEVQYGKVEARIKLPMGQGIWPAFWMLGSNITEVSWPQCGEIDIMEHVSNSEYIHGTYHYNNGGHTYFGEDYWCDVTQFHVYGIEWTQNSIKWFVDGALYYTANISEGVGSTEEFHHPFFLILNMATGGYWPGYPDETTVFPANMFVDYVRVYQKDFAQLEENLEEITISTFPNPCNDILHIRGNNDMNLDYQLVSLSGQEIQHGSLYQVKSINLKHVPAGTYILNIASQEGIIRKRIKVTVLPIN